MTFYILANSNSVLFIICLAYESYIDFFVNYFNIVYTRDISLNLYNDIYYFY
jgi:hypothetical protein